MLLLGNKVNHCQVLLLLISETENNAIKEKYGKITKQYSIQS